MEHINRENFTLLVDALSAVASVFTMWVLFRTKMVEPTKGTEVGTQTSVVGTQYDSEDSFDPSEPSEDDDSGVSVSEVDSDCDSYIENTSTVSEGGDSDTYEPAVDVVRPIGIHPRHPRAGLLLQSSGMWDLPRIESELAKRQECQECQERPEFSDDEDCSSENDGDGFVPELISVDF